MLVNLRRGWFDPAGNRRRVSDNPHDFPDDWKDQLPSTAEVLPAAEVKAIAKAEKEAEKAK
jgi:hypothetical protein